MVIVVEDKDWTEVKVAAFGKKIDVKVWMELR